MASDATRAPCQGENRWMAISNSSSASPIALTRGPLGAYWAPQWTMGRPHVEPLSFHRTADGAIVAEVRQSVRDLEGNPLQGQTHGLKDKTVGHVSVFERARWLASTYRTLPRAQTCLEPERYSGGKGDA